MIIRGYKGIPTTYAPDVGEVVWARRTPVESWVRAAILTIRRNSKGDLKFTVWWLEDDPDAGSGHEGRGSKPIKAHTRGWIEVKRGPGVPPLIKQITKDTPAQD
jgi:hypothetical protein